MNQVLFASPVSRFVGRFNRSRGNQGRTYILRFNLDIKCRL